MRKGQFRAIFVFGLLAVFSIVAAPKLPELMALTGMAVGSEPIQELEVGSSDIDNIALTGERLVFELSVPVENPNQFPARVDRVNYTVYINETRVAEDAVPGETTIPEGSETEIDVNLTADTDRVESGLLVLQDEATSVRIEGDIYTDIGPARIVTSFESER